MKEEQKQMIVQMTTTPPMRTLLVRWHFPVKESEGVSAWNARTVPVGKKAISSDDFNLTESFYNAVWNGNWHATNELISRNPDAVRAGITYSGRTALHVAAYTGHMSIVETLLVKMSEKDLEIKEIDDFTALAIAATYNASIKIAECMVRKNTKILTIDVANMLPAALAFRYGNVEMGRYLYTVTPLEYLVLPQNGIDGAMPTCIALYM